MFCHRWIDSHQASTFCLELVKVVCLSTMSHINALMIKAHQAFKTILKSKSYLETMQQSAFRPGFLPCKYANASQKMTLKKGSNFKTMKPQVSWKESV